jgi:acetyl esterase/lipase
MNLETIHPELRDHYRHIPHLPFHCKLFVSIANFFLRLRPNKNSVDGVGVVEHKTDDASVRVYTPPTPGSGAALFWVHGGGLLIGRASINDALCAKYARDLNLVVVSANYRLASKQPYPAASDDCFNAWRWLQASASVLGVDPSRIAISGQSAGGGLAASLVQRIFDTGEIQPAGQALLCPMLDDRTAAREELDAIKHRMWNNRSNRAGWSAYLDQPVGLPDTPDYAVPARREDLTGIPPTWIGVGDIDLFYEEGRNYSENLRKCGVDCEFHVVPMAPHAFELLAPDASITQEFFESNYAFLRVALGL